MAGQIAVVGSLNMDLVLEAPRIPAVGETVVGARDLQQFPGGKGANQAVAAARLGADVHMIGRVGDDDFAPPVLESLRAAGVHADRVRTDPEAATGLGLIVVDPDGNNAIVVASGANARVTAEDAMEAEDVIAASDILLLQLEIPMEATLAAARIGRRHGVTTILNPAPARDLPDGLLAWTDVLIPNEVEASMLSGQSLEGAADVDTAATLLRARGCDAVIVTLGARGCALAAAAGVTHFPAHEVEVVDTTAAGDAFVAGLAAALADGRDVAGAIAQGSATAALACTVLGAQPSLPQREAVDRLLGGSG